MHDFKRMYSSTKYNLSKRKKYNQRKYYFNFKNDERKT